MSRPEPRVQPLLDVFGRFHPVVLHAPIGLLIALVVVELAGRREDQGLRRATSWLAWAAAASASLAAGTGWVLSLEGGYDNTTLDRHFSLGLAVAGLSVLLAASTHIRGHAVRRVLLVLTLAVLGPAGHFGGVMTHGENFLFGPLTRGQTAGGATDASTSGGPIATPTIEGPFARIEPILADHCYACHGAEKQKGGLALHTPDAILFGGDTGAAILPGDAARSELLRRMKLPADDHDRMPPKGKPQPTMDQIAAIEAWIAAGAPMPGVAPGTTPPAPSAPAPDPDASDFDDPIVDEPGVSALPAPDPEAINAVRDALAHVQPVARDSRMLTVSFAALAAAATDDVIVGLLTPLRDHIEDLSLARTAVTDRSLELVAAMPNLRRLDLRATAVSALGLARLAEHPAIADLVLAQTSMSDAAAATLKQMPRLSRVWVWKAGLSADALAALSAARPGLRLDAGESLVTRAIQTEPPLTFSGDALRPGDPSGAPPAEVLSLKPVNSVCPVAGTPVNPKYTIVHGGRVIAFCCENCPKTFWSDPAAYEANIKP